MSQLKVDRDWDLSRDEFADAIAKGLGRAFLYVSNYCLERVKNLVLIAFFTQLCIIRNAKKVKIDGCF